MHTGLPDLIKAKLRRGIGTVHKSPSIIADMIRGYGGERVDRYDTTDSEKRFLTMAEKLKKVQSMREAILRRAAAGTR